jgi:hypothetical protein
MNFLNDIDKFSSNPCLIDEEGKKIIYKDVLEEKEKKFGLSLRVSGN